MNGAGIRAEERLAWLRCCTGTRGARQVPRDYGTTELRDDETAQADLWHHVILEHIPARANSKTSFASLKNLRKQECQLSLQPRRVRSTSLEVRGRLATSGGRGTEGARAAAVGKRGVGACDSWFRGAACVASESGFSQRIALDLRLGKIHRRGLVWGRGHSRASVWALVHGRRFQRGCHAAGMAVCGVGAVFLYRRDGGGGARAGSRLLFREPGADLPAAAQERAAIPGDEDLSAGSGLA